MIFNSTPPDYTSVNDDILWVAYDINSIDPAKVNYKYVGELFIAGEKVFTSKVFPRPDINMGVFNLGSVIREYVKAKLSPTGNGIHAQEMGQGVFAIDCVLKIREEYNGTLGAVVLEDSTRTFFNHYSSRFSDFTTEESFTYTLSFIFGFLNLPNTSRPGNIELFLTTDKFYLPYFSVSADPFDVVIGANTTTITPSGTNTLQLINVSPAAINIDFPGTITAGTSSYTVVIGDLTYTIRIICEPIYSVYMVHFLNKFGGFETMSFHKVSREMIDVERKEWQQLAYRIDDLGAVTLSEGGIMNEQRSVFASRYKEKLRISTDLLSDQEYAWLAQLVASPLVYLQDGFTVYPVVITNSNYEKRKYINDKLSNISIDIEFGKMVKTQFR
jgi:hypothetical protein